MLTTDKVLVILNKKARESTLMQENQKSVSYLDIESPEALTLAKSKITSPVTITQTIIPDSEWNETNSNKRPRESTLMQENKNSMSYLDFVFISNRH